MPIDLHKEEIHIGSRHLEAEDMVQIIVTHTKSGLKGQAKAFIAEAALRLAYINLQPNVDAWYEAHYKDNPVAPYEYQIVHENSSQVTDRLNNEALNGWRLVSAHPCLTDSSHNWQITMYFERLNPNASSN